MKLSSRTLAAGSLLSAVAFAPTVIRAEAITNYNDFSANIRNPSTMFVPISGLVLGPGESLSSLTLEFTNIGAAASAFVPASSEPAVVFNASIDLNSARFYILAGSTFTPLTTVTLNESLPNGGINVSNVVVPASGTDTTIDQGSWVQSPVGSVVLTASDLATAGVTIGQPFYVRISVNQTSNTDSIVNYAGTISGRVTFTYEKTTGDIPEPASFIGLAAGLSGLILLRRGSK